MVIKFDYILSPVARSEVRQTARLSFLWSQVFLVEFFFLLSDCCLDARLPFLLKVVQLLLLALLCPLKMIGIVCLHTSSLRRV